MIDMNKTSRFGRFGEAGTLGTQGRSSARSAFGAGDGRRSGFSSGFGSCTLKSCLCHAGSQQ